MLVAHTAVPVVPCLIQGAYQAMPSNRRYPQTGKLKLKFGQPINFEDQPNTKTGWQAIAQQCESAIQSL